MVFFGDGIFGGGVYGGLVLCTVIWPCDCDCDFPLCADCCCHIYLYLHRCPYRVVLVMVAFASSYFWYSHDVDLYPDLDPDLWLSRGYLWLCHGSDPVPDPVFDPASSLHPHSLRSTSKATSI